MSHIGMLLLEKTVLSDGQTVIHACRLKVMMLYVSAYKMLRDNRVGQKCIIFVGIIKPYANLT